MFDHTDPTNDGIDYSQVLTGGNTSQIGVAKSIQVYPGDKVKIEAYAKYYNPQSNSSNLNGFALALTSAFGVSSTSTGEALKAFNSLNNYGGIIAGSGGESGGTYPKLFVNILLFDRNFKLVDAAWQQIDGGEQVGVSPKAAHDYMMQEVDVKEAGYAYIYVSNENATLVEFYVDDVVITHTPSNIIQYNEYYPFGMQTANSWTRENTTGNSFLYNEGSELNTTSGYYDLPYRTYDPVLGRMNGVDPLASKYASLTPYNYSNNDPVFYTDPSGAEYGVPEWLTRRLDQLPHIDGGGGSDGYQGMSALDRSFGSMKLIVKRIDWYTNGIIDDEHFIDSEYSFEMQYQQGLLQEGTGVKPWPIDIWDEDKTGVLNGLLNHLSYMGHNPDKPYHLRDIVKTFKEPAPWWKGWIPSTNAGNSTGGLAKIFGTDVQWYIGVAGNSNTDNWKVSKANMNLEVSAKARDGVNFINGKPATIYQITVWGGSGDRLIYINFLNKDAWDKTYNYLKGYK